jgi:hypothetical protein
MNETIINTSSGVRSVQLMLIEEDYDCDDDDFIIIIIIIITTTINH